MRSRAPPNLGITHAPTSLISGHLSYSERVPYFEKTHPLKVFGIRRGEIRHPELHQRKPETQVHDPTDRES